MVEQLEVEYTLEKSEDPLRQKAVQEAWTALLRLDPNNTKRKTQR